MGFKCHNEREVDEYAIVADVLQEETEVSKQDFDEAVKGCAMDSTWLFSPPIFFYYASEDYSGDIVGKRYGYAAEGRIPGKSDVYFLFLAPKVPRKVVWAKQGLTREQRDIFKQRREAGYYKQFL